MTLKKNFNFIANSTEAAKNRSFQGVSNNTAGEHNYIDSYMKDNKYAFSNANYQDQRLRNLSNYNTDPKQFDYTTSKFNGNKLSNKLS